MKIAETLSMVSSHQVPLDIHIPNGTFLNHFSPPRPSENLDFLLFITVLRAYKAL